ncbi:FAST kinase domain-containing protein 2, mitochondrial [Pristis pectinata]|uniref:FAST kinase domain-containing protein 2, mitochondrial n=1 Tax=Pristis pectinata TaxID=685728 RepID=UPI00223DE418|nr:FAST kinase domain-containing protein 2, mitochondrial [Pristis pectinata]
MNAHPAGSQLVRILRLCSSFSRGYTVTGYGDCSTLIQKNGFVSSRTQNGFLYHLKNCLGLTLFRFQSSERMPHIPSEAEDVNNHTGETKDSSVVPTPSISSSTNTASSQYRGPTTEGSSTDWKSMSLMERRRSWEQFCDELQQCTSPSDVLDLYRQSHVTWKHISNSLMTLWATTKRMSDDQKRYERKLMFEHPVFEEICQQALKEAQLMSCNDLVYSLFALVKIGVSQHSRLIHTLLRVSQERLNEFDERALSVLSSCLRTMEESKNVIALRAGLRLLVELRIPNIKTVMALQTMMRCIGKESPLPLKKKLENKALSLLNQFTLPNSQYMFITLAVMGYRSYPLLEACSNRVIENIHGVPFWRLVHLLQSCKDLSYRNAALLTAAGNHVASMLAIWEVKQLILFLKLFADLGFRHIELMDGFAQMVPARSESLTFKDMLSTLRVYSLLNHCPEEGRIEQFLQTLIDLFQSHLSKCSSLELLQGVYYLCLLRHYPSAALNQLFQDDVLSELQSSANLNREANKRTLQCIKLCMELENPSFAVPEIARIAEPLPASFVVNSAMKEVVEAILGDGSPYRWGSVLRNVHFIDFEIALDQERKCVVPLPQDDEIIQSTNIQRVAVLCAPVSAFCLGTEHPKDKLALKVRHLKALGYHVVLVSEHEFGKMSEDERVEFLKSAIFGE